MTLRALAGLALVGLAIVLAPGCAGDRDELPPPVRRVGLRFEQFPDIPFPPSWKPVPGEDHVAIAIANGAARRLALAMQPPPARTDIEPPEAIRRNVAGILPETGWRRDPTGEPDDLEQRWVKGDEVLVVTASRSGGLALLRWRLEKP